MVPIIFSKSEERKRAKDLKDNPFIFRAAGVKMAASASSVDCYHETVLDDVFENYGPIDVDAFIDSQFENALRGEEQMYCLNHGETQHIGSKGEDNMEDGCSSTLQSFAYGNDTQINFIDRTISLTTPQGEMESDVVCPSCRRVLEKDELDNFGTFSVNKVNRQTTTQLNEQEKTNGCEIDGRIEVRGT